MNTSHTEISDKEAKFYLALKAGGWKTAAELAKEIGGNERTVRAYALRFARLGVAEKASVFPSHKYRFFSGKASKPATDYIKRLDQTVEIFGIKESNG